MKLIAPEVVDHFDFHGHEYRRDADGHFNITNPDHIQAAMRHGAVEFDPDAEDPFAQLPVVPVVETALAEKDEQLAKAAEEADELRRQLAEMQARTEAAEKAAADAAAALAAAGADDASGDTSEEAGDTDDHPAEDKMAAALAKNPNFDDMDRDEMVKWLSGVGVVVSVSISKVKAREAIDEAIADYKKDKGE